MKRLVFILAGSAFIVLLGVVLYSFFGNHAPKFVSTPELLKDRASVLKNNGYVYQVDVADADRDNITVTLVNAPDGMTIDSATGRIFWPSDKIQTGTHDIMIQATDEHGKQATQVYPLTAAPEIFDINAPQAAIQIEPNVVVAGAPATITVSATDISGIKTIELRMNGTPVALDTSGKAIVTPKKEGTYVFDATAWDGAQNQGQAQQQLEVKSSNFDMTIRFWEGFDAEEGTTERDPTLLAFYPESIVGEGFTTITYLPPTSPKHSQVEGERFTKFNPPNDFYFDFDAERNTIPAIVSETGVAVAILKGQSYERVDASLLDTISLSENAAEEPITPNDTLIIKTIDGNFFKVGNFYRRIQQKEGANSFDASLLFNYQRLTQ